MDGSLASYSHWQENEPNVEKRPGWNVCGEMFALRGTWNNLDCLITNSYICERDYKEPVSCLGETWILNGRNKKCYQLQTDARTFHESRVNCQIKGGGLAIVADDGTLNYTEGSKPNSKWTPHSCPSNGPRKSLPRTIVLKAGSWGTWV